MVQVVRWKLTVTNPAMYADMPNVNRVLSIPPPFSTANLEMMGSFSPGIMKGVRTSELCVSPPPCNRYAGNATSLVPSYQRGVGRDGCTGMDVNFFIQREG